MKVYIQAQNVALDESLKDYINRKINFAFSRVKRHISSIAVVLTDENGPKGGFDKQCRLIIGIEKADKMVVTHTQTEVHSAVSGAMRRAGTTVTRLLSRRYKSKRHIPLSHQPLLISE